MRRSEKIFLVFVVIILIPSIIFAYKVYDSIDDKKDTLFLKERLQIANILNQISEKTEEELLKRERVETRRPYYEYSYYFAPEEVVSNNYVLQKSPISKVPDDKLISGYFQIDDEKRLTTPYLFYDEKENEKIPDLEYKRQFLTMIDSKIYPTLVKEIDSGSKTPLKTVSQSAHIQQSYENIEDIYNIISQDSSEKFKFAKEIEFKNLKRNVNWQVIKNQLDEVKYYPIQYLYKKGGLFAFRKITATKKTYIQGYMINLVYLTDDILHRFISKNTPDNFAIYSQPQKGSTPYASASISDKLDFIKLYVYKKDNSYIDSIIKEETIKYYIITFILFSIILVGCTFIYKTIRSEAEINQKKGDFISAVTHELKTPLTSIRLYSEMLSDDMVKDEQKKKVYYDYMLKESERLTRLINNVLDFSKIENNKKVFQMEKGGLNELLIELCEKYKNNLKLAGFEFSYEINDIEEVAFDKDAITQVFINLLDNAVKYSAAGNEKKIDVKLYEVRDKIIFEVVDKGIGIPKSEQKAIFEKFHRIENELTRTSKGSGIGLSIVKAYINAHGGKIEVFSKEKEGSKFRITLPRIQNV